MSRESTAFGTQGSQVREPITALTDRDAFPRQGVSEDRRYEPRLEIT